MADMTERVIQLEVKHKELRADVAEIKDQVTNHLPTQIAAVKQSVDDLITQHVAADAVRHSWDVNLKRFLILMGIIWTTLRVLEFVRGI